MTIRVESIMIISKNLAEKLVLVNIKDNAKKYQQIKQRTRGAYTILISQLKAMLVHLITNLSKK